MSFGNIFEKVKDALDGNDEEQIDGHNVLPASQDPYGDPADQVQNGYDPRFGNVVPASQDPRGDPADQEAGYGNVLPASQDPYGDPADQENGQQPQQDQGIVGNILGKIFGH